MTQRRTSDHLFLAALAAALLLVPLAGCKKKEAPLAPAPSATSAPAPAPVPAAHTEIRIGKAVGADKRVGETVATFAATDTIYASAGIHGRSGALSVRALWKYQDGQTVSEDSQSINADGGATAEFHISKPNGFPAGSYTVEIFVDGASAGTSTFTVR